MPHQNFMLKWFNHLRLNQTYFSDTFTRQVLILLQDKVNRLLNIVQQYKRMSAVNKEQQLKGNTFKNPVIFLAIGESNKIVLDDGIWIF